jgi:hypothetical protein
MSGQTISQPSFTQRPTTEPRPSQPERRDAVGRREPSRSRSTVRPLPAPFAGRPRGHVAGLGIGEPPAQSFAGRPRGHVVALQTGESFLGRPRGHIVGRGTGTALPSPSTATYREAA